MASDLAVKNLQVCFWSDSCSSAGRLAGNACGAHWFHAHGIQHLNLMIPLYKNKILYYVAYKEAQCVCIGAFNPNCLSLQPHGFFNCSPAVDVPPSSADPDPKENGVITKPCHPGLVAKL